MTDGVAVAVDGRVTPAAEPDVAALSAVLGAALRTAGLPAGPDRCERLAGALTVMRASTIAELHACALATIVSDPSQIDTFERVFAELFGVGAPGRLAQPNQPQPGMTIEPSAEPSPADAPSSGGADLSSITRQVVADTSSSSSSA
jgi:uncharacterized protein with von Willebrand factor type A (vWA) domain